MKKALTLTMIVVAALAWSVATATASYSSLDALKPTKHGAKPIKVVTVTKPGKGGKGGTVTKPFTVIYIYWPAPAVAQAPLSPADQCAAENEDLIEHALDPLDCSSTVQQTSTDQQTGTEQQ